MKTLFLLQKHLLKGCLLLLFVSGCVKEPGPDIPLPVNKPEWLLAKYTEVTGHGDPILGPIHGEFYYSKRVTEFKYNQYYKPSLKLEYISFTQGDTTNLVLYYKDTFYYDRHLRVTQIKSHRSDILKAAWLKKFYYTGNDTLPNLFENYSYDSVGNPVLLYGSRYVYWGDTAVIRLPLPSKGYDSVKYVYEHGNYTASCRGKGMSSCLGEYTGYTGRNYLLYLNLSHAMGIDLYLAYSANDGPRISRGNWQERYDDPNNYRRLTFNENGLLVRTFKNNFYPEAATTSYFEYMKVE